MKVYIKCNTFKFYNFFSDDEIQNLVYQYIDQKLSKFCDAT